MISIIIPNTDAFPQLRDTSKIRKASQVGVLLHNFDGEFLSAGKRCSCNSPRQYHKRGH